ncbi:response regulator transcription factor [Rapidithrix thailandica]|uniref:Response regulator transcription factor n=1 Tax=Rapidithrix thailandica TaxID=413964 RepID=A0AAW9SFC1_9BACT
MVDSIKILLCEDDRVMANVVKKYLDVRGYEITWCDNGNAGLKAFSKYRFDLCIFDVNMPYKDGYTLAQEIRNRDKYIPILFMSSNTLPKDKIKAFRIGADDYVAKPIDVEELLLRIEVIMKRQNSQPKVAEDNESKKTKIQIGKYLLDFPYQKLTIGEEERKLTTREAELLRFLYIHRNDLIKREFILQEVWGDDDYYKGRSLDVFMSRLRKYLKDDPGIEIINVHGIGFKFLIADEVEQKEGEEEGKGNGE